MGKDLLEKLTRLSAEKEREEKEKARFTRARGSHRRGKAAKAKEKARHNPKTVKCAFCQNEVQAADTVETPIGPACKTHPGVG